MKQPITKITILLLFSLCIASCASKENTKPVDDEDPIEGTYYITYKMDGVEISSALKGAGRVTDIDPKVLNITGAASGGSNPSIVISTEETFIGFVNGLNVGCSSSTFPSHFVSITNSSGDQFTSADNDDGIDVFFSKISYEVGGEVEGTFSGKVEDFSGNISSITEGKFKLKFID